MKPFHRLYLQVPTKHALKLPKSRVPLQKLETVMNYAFELQYSARENEVQARTLAIIFRMTGHAPSIWILKLDLRCIVLAEQQFIQRAKIFRREMTAHFFFIYALIRCSIVYSNKALTSSSDTFPHLIHRPFANARAMIIVAAMRSSVVMLLAVQNTVRSKSVWTRMVSS
jgi:hypothetical protein